MSEFHAEVPQATASERLNTVPTWRLERDSNPRLLGRKASNLPMRHHAPRVVIVVVDVDDDNDDVDDDVLIAISLDKISIYCTGQI